MIETMQFSSFSEFLDMGGYAFNVWSVYALFVLFFVINLYFPLQRKKQILREQKRRLLLHREMASAAGDADERDLSVPIGDSGETT